MALVNVAAQLAKMGRTVLLVDFDLEAPGLETFDLLRPAKPHPGMVEYVTEICKAQQANPRCPRLCSTLGLAQSGKRAVRLWVMPYKPDAGMRAIRPALVKIDWAGALSPL